MERYTRIRNKILEKCTIIDMGEEYLGRSNRRLIYLDNLKHYLPNNISENHSGGLLRPEFILDNIQNFIPGG